MSDQHQTNLRFIARFNEIEQRIDAIEIVLSGLRRLLQEDLERKGQGPWATS